MVDKPHYSREPYSVYNIGGSSGGGGGGMRFIAGEGGPGSDVGQPGDVYLDTESGDLYTNKNGIWEEEMNLRGPEGPKGDKGDPGEDGYPSQEEWEDLLSEVDNIKSRLDDLENVE